VALLMSFENFNTTLMLVGSDAPLPITMYGQMREGATPAINAVSLLLMLGVGGIASIFALTAKAER
jgi:spermidine/putrescine transport system permease protein